MGNACGKKGDVDEKNRDEKFQKVSPNKKNHNENMQPQIIIDHNKHGIKDDDALMVTNDSKTMRKESSFNDKEKNKQNSYLIPQNPESHAKNSLNPSDIHQTGLRKTARPIKMPAKTSGNQNLLSVKN